MLVWHMRKLKLISFKQHKNYVYVLKVFEAMKSDYSSLENPQSPMLQINGK